MQKRETILVIDWGTTKVHTNIVSVLDGSAVVSNSIEYSTVNKKVIGQDFSLLTFWEAAERSLNELLVHCDLSKYSITAMTFSCFAYCIIAADKYGTPISDIIYGMDMRSGKYLDIFRALMTDEEYSSATGCMPNLLQVPAKILWLQNTLSQKPEKFLTLQQFILSNLGLEPLSDYSCIAQGILNLKTGILSPKIMEVIGTNKKMFGDVVESATIVGNITHFGRVQLPNSMCVVLGAHDAVCGGLGLGIWPKGRKDIMGNCAGTADLLCLFSDEFKNVWPKYPELCATAGVVKGSNCYHIGVASGVILDWFVREFGGTDVSEALKRMGNHLSSKVRTLVDEKTLSTSFYNLSISTKFDELLNSLMETLAFIIRKHLRELTDVSGQKAKKVRIGASGARSDYQVQLKADIIGIPVERVKNLEVSSVGAAIIASVATGIYDDYAQAIEQMVRVERVFIPDKERMKIYDDKYNEYLKLHIK